MEINTLQDFNKDVKHEVKEEPEKPNLSLPRATSLKFNILQTKHEKGLFPRYSTTK